jgi:hypothetical protein
MKVRVLFNHVQESNKNMRYYAKRMEHASSGALEPGN